MRLRSNLYLFHISRLYPALTAVGEAHLHPAVIGIHYIHFGTFMNNKQSSGFINRAAFYIHKIAENNGLLMIIKITQLPAGYKN